MGKYAILILPITLSIIILIAGSIDLLLAYPLTRCFYWFVEAFWHKEDATLPAVLILCVPSFGFILSAYLITRKKLR